MNVRDATPGDEPWLIETLDRLDSHDPGFRWYHYVVVTTDDGDRVGLGQITEHDEETVELSRIRGFGERPTVARAHAARGLVKRAIEDGFETILVAAESTRPFEAVGFRETDDRGRLDPATGETAMVWVSPAEREDDEDENEEEVTEDEGEGDSASETASDTPTGETTDDSTPTYKYDPDAATPATGASTTADDESEPSEATTDGDDSTVAAARRQGFDPDRVETKYDTDDKTRSRTAKYDTDEQGTSQSDGEKDDQQSSGDEPSNDSETKYDTDDSEESPNTKYTV